MSLARINILILSDFAPDYMYTSYGPSSASLPFIFWSISTDGSHFLVWSNGLFQSSQASPVVQLVQSSPAGPVQPSWSSGLGGPADQVV